MQTRPPRRAGRRPTPRAARPLVDPLEGRTVPSLLRVVPAYGQDDWDTFTSLQDAFGSSKPGDVVQIEPGSTPGSATSDVPNLTIQGDPQFGGAGGLQAAGTEIGTLTLNAVNDTVTNVYLSSLAIKTAISGTVLSNSIVNGGTVTQATGTGNNGGNTILGNTFLNNARLTLGNTGGSTTATASGDQVVFNVFQGDGTVTPITVTNETTGLLIANNRLNPSDVGAFAFGMLIGDCVGTVSGNVIRDIGNAAIYIVDSFGSTRSTNVTVANNVAYSQNTGLLIGRSSKANTFAVAVTNNSFAGDGNGIQVLGNNAGGSSDFGNITLTGNDFRGIAATGGHYAIQLFDSSTTATINARGNIFGVSNPATVVTPAAQVDTSNPLTGGAANLTAKFLTLGAGPPAASQHAALDGASDLAQASGAVRSPQALTVLVDNLYVNLLGRVPMPGEDQALVNALLKGATEEQAIVGMVSSAEYYARVAQGSDNPDAAWVRSLYVNLLGRQPAASEVKAWAGLVPALGLTGVAMDIVNSFEFHAAQVRAYFGARPIGVIPAPDLLRVTSPVAASGIAAWVNTGLDLLTIEALILGSPQGSAL